MAIDNIARVIPMKGKYVVKRRGMYVSEVYRKREDAQKVADRWNENYQSANKYIKARTVNGASPRTQNGSKKS